MNRMKFSTDKAIEVPMPPKVAALDRTASGVPIPANVLRKDNGVPVFTVNDMERELRMLVDGLCSVTGTKLDNDDVWMVAGPQSALDPRGVVNDSPMCGEAKDYALKVCPYFAMPKYVAIGVEAKAKLGEKYNGVDPTRSFEPVPYHVAMKVKGMQIMPTPNGVMFVVSRDFERVEFWKEGVITHEFDTPDAIETMLLPWVDKAMKLGHLAEYQVEALFGHSNGMFPWNSGLTFDELLHVVTSVIRVEIRT